jgi:hypothetical protein
MPLQRENILLLIGSKRYHSAIITTFSFDFIFFEMKAMKWLRSRGVRNVNVLVDGYYYSELLNKSYGYELRVSASYSLYPIFNKSIFHPKIWMLFGEKEGLLIIGSGNLTNAGNGNNDEIWGAFHFDIHSMENAELFSASWTYLQDICSNVKGFTNVKAISWIVENTKWLGDLPANQPFQFLKLSATEKIAYLTNNQNSTIWQQMSDLISKEQIIEITTLSPFYDINGKAIEALSTLFPTAKINVVVDESGAIPERLGFSSLYTFYNWYDLEIPKTTHSKTGNYVTRSKLHAKIIHFKTNSTKEYCLFGSANVTPEGLGLPGVIANSEMSLLIQSDEGGLLSQLEIDLKSPVKLSDFKSNKNISLFESLIKSTIFRIRLLSAEWLYDELHLFTECNYSAPISVKLFDRDGKILHKLNPIQLTQNIVISDLFPLNDSHHVQLYDEHNDTPISNKALLSDNSLLAKTYPNSKLTEIENIYNDIQNGDLTKFLDLLSYATSDEIEETDTRATLASNNNENNKKDNVDDPKDTYELSSYKIVQHNSIERNLLSNSLSLRVLDILKFVRSREFAANNELQLRTDEQEDDLGNIDGVDENDLNVNRNKPFSQLNSDKKKLRAYFNKLTLYLEALVYSKNEQKKYRPTFSDFGKYLVALELIFEYGNKTERYFEDDQERFFRYFDLKSENSYTNSCVKGCCLNIIGYFLMLIRNGVKEYKFEYTKTKINQLQSDALISSIVCLLNVKWKDEELPYFNTMMLNSLHYFGEKDPDKFIEMLPILLRAVTLKVTSLNHPIDIISNNYEWFEKRIIPAFHNTILHLSAKTFDYISNKGHIIYKSPWGYCYVKDILRQNQYTLVRPGFLWDKSSREFTLYDTNKIYNPIKLESFIRVNI